jgi:hypothetical protein
MSKVKRPRTEAKNDADPVLSVKGIDANELERWITQDFGYEKRAFQQQRVTHLRQFAEFVCEKLKMKWEDLCSMDTLLRAASLVTTGYPPPGGSTLFFAVTPCCFDVLRSFEFTMMMLCSVQNGAARLGAGSGSAAVNSEGQPMDIDVEPQKTSSKTKKEAKSSKDEKSEATESELRPKVCVDKSYRYHPIYAAFDSRKEET